MIWRMIQPLIGDWQERTGFATSVVFTYIGSAVLTSAGIVSTIISKHIFLRFRQRELIHTSISFQ